MPLRSGDWGPRLNVPDWVRQDREDRASEHQTACPNIGLLTNLIHAWDKKGDAMCYLLSVAGGHAGYEIAPFIPSIEGLLSLFFCGARPSGGLNTVQHHDMHHRHPKVHFSLYMTHWDRLMKTEHPGYRAAVARHFAIDVAAS